MQLHLMTRVNQARKCALIPVWQNLLTFRLETPMDISPLDDNELDYLNDMIFKYGSDAAVGDVSELDGFLTAIASGPQDVQPDAWYAEIWGGELPVWEDASEQTSFTTLVNRMMGVISGTLLEDPDNYEALFLEQEMGDRFFLVVDPWCAGYLRGIGMNAESWGEMPEELMAEHLYPVMVFAGDENDEELQSLTEEALEDLQQRLEPAACAIHAYWHGQRQ